MVYDVVVIGAGQAGLAMGYYLKQTSLSYLLLDNHKRVGEAWRKRYDSLVLFTPREYSSLPGLPIEGRPTGFPTKNEIADYLELYAQAFDLPIQFNCQVVRVEKDQDLYTIYTNDLPIKAKNIVVATGPFHIPRIPSFAKELPEGILQLHSSEYKNPRQLIEGTVLVVGGGNSGGQIAVELSDYYETYLSVGQKIRFMPLTFAAKSIFWWFDKMGILQADRNSRIGQKIQIQGDPIFGHELKERLKNNRIMLKGRTKSIRQNQIQFADTSTVSVQNVIWATGFKQDYSWIDLPELFNQKGLVKHTRGVTEIEGLYFLGLPWQHLRGSALLLGVGEDAFFLSRQINKPQLKGKR